MSTGRRICPECKGNGYLRTDIDSDVQCLNCWSEGEIDESIWARKYDLFALTSCSPTRKKIDKYYWDPIKVLELPMASVSEDFAYLAGLLDGEGCVT